MFRTKLMIFVTLVSMLAMTFAFAMPVKADHHMSGNTIVDIAVSVNKETGEFSTLIAALKYTNLVKDLARTNKQYTVFAPTDAAFAKLGLNAENIVKMDRKTLKYILRYHVALKERFSGDVVASTQIRMWTRDFVTVSLPGDGSVKINDATILAVDIDASNGVIHVIDTVLLPPAK